MEYFKNKYMYTLYEAICIPVNCFGLMSDPITKKMKIDYPDMYSQYKEAWKLKEIKKGKIYTYRNYPNTSPSFIFLLPVRRHWSEKPRWSYIKSGLSDLFEKIKYYKIESILLYELTYGSLTHDMKNVIQYIEQMKKEQNSSLLITIYNE